MWSKIIEIFVFYLLCLKLTNVLSRPIKNVIIDEQYGLMENRSTNTNLLKFMQYLIDNVELGYDVCYVYADLRKADDGVNISKLIVKLKSLGIGGYNPILLAENKELKHLTSSSD